MKNVIMMICALFLSAAVSAAQAPESIPYPYLGERTCRQFASDYAADPSGDIELRYIAWAQGYMSAMNEYNEKQPQLRNLNAWSLAEQKVWFRTYCNVFPMAGYTEAATNLFYSTPAMPQEKPQ